MADSLTRGMRQAIAAPASITERQVDDTTGQFEGLLDWQVRAVLTVLVDGRWVPDPHPRPPGPLGIATWFALALVIGLVLGVWLL